MQFQILGPLEVRRQGRQVAVGAAKQRALLAILLVHANELVSSDRLIEELWPQPPETAANTLQVYVGKLRKALEPGRARGAPGELLITRSPGYMLRVEAGQLDAERFETLLADGSRAREAGEHQAAAEVLREALGLWRGEALADFVYEPFAQAEIARLEELRTVAARGAPRGRPGAGAPRGGPRRARDARPRASAARAAARPAHARPVSRRAPGGRARGLSGRRDARSPRSSGCSRPGAAAPRGGDPAARSGAGARVRSSVRMDCAGGVSLRSSRTDAGDAEARHGARRRADVEAGSTRRRCYRGTNDSRGGVARPSATEARCGPRGDQVMVVFGVPRSTRTTR